jgi:hypothetical protein
MSSGSRPAFVVASMISLLASTGLPVDAQKATREEFSAFAVNMGTAFGLPGTGPKSGQVQITIERWSTAEERQALVSAFQQKGPDGLLRALQKNKRVGFIRTPTSLGYDLQFSRQVPGEDGGRRIIIATDRYIGAREAREQPRTVDYPFTLIELRLNKNNEGEGKLAIATKIVMSKDKQHVELENYGTEPVRLQNVQPR